MPAPVFVGIMKVRRSLRSGYRQRKRIRTAIAVHAELHYL